MSSLFVEWLRNGCSGVSSLVAEWLRNGCGDRPELSAEWYVKEGEEEEPQEAVYEEEGEQLDDELRATEEPNKEGGTSIEKRGSGGEESV